MHLKVFRPLWGIVKQAGGHLSVPDALKAIASLGYAGVECPVGLALHYGAPEFKQLLADNNLQWCVCRCDGVARCACRDVVCR